MAKMAGIGVPNMGVPTMNGWTDHQTYLHDELLKVSKDTYGTLNARDRLFALALTQLISITVRLEQYAIENSEALKTRYEG